MKNTKKDGALTNKNLKRLMTRLDKMGAGLTDYDIIEELNDMGIRDYDADIIITQAREYQWPKAS